VTTVVWSYGQSYTEGTYWSYGQLKIFKPYTAGVTTIEVSEDVTITEEVIVEEKEFAESLAIIVSKPPSGKYAVKGIWFVNGGLQFRVSPESQAVVTSFLAGYASQTIQGVKNIYCDEEGNIFYETDDKPQQYIASRPPKGYKKVVNVYYDPETEKIVFEYRGDGI